VKPTLPLISTALTAAQLRERVIAQVPILSVGNGKPPVKPVKP
jgi:hypothetical protein